MTSSFGSDWGRILKDGGLKDSPGRDQAVIDAKAISQRKRELKFRVKSNGRSSQKRATFPSLKHAKDVM